MKVWFGATSLEIERYYPYYKKIREFLLSRGCIVEHDWIDDAYQYKLNNPYGRRNIKNIYNRILETIDKVDLSVIEYTVPNFSSSHQIIYSLHKKKPTLVMRLKRDNTFADSYIEAIDDDNLSVEQYDLKTLEDVLSEFLGYSQVEKGYGRYNVVLDKRQKYYLDWIKAKRKISRSSIIRKAIDEIMKRDEEYFK